MSSSSSSSSNNTNKQQHYFGWVPDLPDQRDKYFRAEKPLTDDEIKALPKKVDLRDTDALKGFAIYDQGQLGSCTSNATAANIQYCQFVESKKKFAPSRLFIYYNTRKDEGNVSSDAGCSIRDAVKSVNKVGCCSEDQSWPYDIKKYTQQPPSQAYTEGLDHQALLYKRIDTSLGNMKACLAIDKNPFMFGMTLYQSFESEEVQKTGIVPMPRKDEQVIGGHALLAVGYDDSTQHFIVRNSWGDRFGEHGYVYIPYAYMTDPNLVDDRWVITLMEGVNIAEYQQQQQQ